MTMPSERPLVSVITIFLNAERFLEEAIESVVAQTYTNWELLLVDDGSADASSTIAMGWAARHQGRIRYLEHRGHVNRGMSATRNLGLRAARGALVAFIDADDVWVPEKLDEQVAIMEAHPEVGMVCGAVRYWYSWTGEPEHLARDKVIVTCGPPNRPVAPPTLLKTLYPLGTGAAPCPSDLLLKRDLVARLGSFEEHFTGERQMYEDQAFFAKLYLNAPVYVSRSVWLWYRQHPQSCVAEVTRTGRYHAVRHYFLEWLAGYLARHRITDREILRALDRALWPYRHPRLSRLGTMARTGCRHGLHGARRVLDAIRRRVMPRIGAGRQG